MRFDDAEKWSKVFENSERDAWQKPDVVLDFMKISENMSVADIGSATGYFDVRIAKAFPSVQMLGVDVEQSLVDFLNKRASDEGLENLSSRVCAFDDAKLDANTQRVLIVDTWHHIEKRVAYLEKLKGYLAKDAAVVIVDFKDVELPFGGPPRAMRLSADEVTKTFVEAGYVLQERDDEGLPYQYMLRFVLDD